MIAARRGQKAAFSPTATSTVAKLPQWGRPADPQPRHRVFTWVNHRAHAPTPSRPALTGHRPRSRRVSDCR
jgi:hypothetical protein